jgi:hypothetical protein
MKLKRICKIHNSGPQVRSVAWSSCQLFARLYGQTVELHTIRENADSKLGVGTGCATGVYRFFFVPSRKLPVGLSYGRNEIIPETFVFTSFPTCYSLIILPIVFTAYDPKFNLVYC